MLLDGLHTRYARERLAHVDRCHPEVKAVQVLGGGKFVGIRRPDLRPRQPRASPGA
jgi:hypothetical protein